MSDESLLNSNLVVHGGHYIDLRQGGQIRTDGVSTNLPSLSATVGSHATTLSTQTTTLASHAAQLAGHSTITLGTEASHKIRVTVALLDSAGNAAAPGTAFTTGFSSITGNLDAPNAIVPDTVVSATLGSVSGGLGIAGTGGVANFDVTNAAALSFYVVVARNGIIDSHAITFAG